MKLFISSLGYVPIDNYIPCFFFTLSPLLALASWFFFLIFSFNSPGSSYFLSYPHLYFSVIIVHLTKRPSSFVYSVSVFICHLYFVVCSQDTSGSLTLICVAAWASVFCFSFCQLQSKSSSFLYSFVFCCC